MYLDTDIILALIKKDDWLKKYVKFSNLEEPQTSTITILEARLILLREYSRVEALEALEKIQKLGIKIISFDENIIKKSQTLIMKYPSLNMFDSIHAASALEHNQTLVSTDHIFAKMDEVNVKNPRDW